MCYEGVIMCYKFKPGKFLMLHQQQKWFWIACIGIYLSLKETFVFFSAYQNFLKKIQRFGMCCEGLSHQYKRMDITSNLCSLILAGKLMLLFISEFSLVTAVVAISSIIWSVWLNYHHYKIMDHRHLKMFTFSIFCPYWYCLFLFFVVIF